MKRDMELIRDILLWVESQDRPFDLINSDFPSAGRDGVEYNVNLLQDGEYLECANVYELPKVRAIEHQPIRSMTWKGHDLLDSIRDEGVWTAIKAKLGDKLSSVPIEIVAAVGVEYLKSKFLPD